MRKLGWQFPYASSRMPVLARNVVATSQPLAAQAGLRMLLKGGNAIDAAVAAAICLTVVEPVSNGIGGDAFALVWDGEQLHGLNASGRSPRVWSPARFGRRRLMPRTGWDSVTVPGAVSAWVALSRRWGRLPFGALFEPAIAYARDGFLVSPRTAAAWKGARPLARAFPEFAAAFFPGGRAPRAGERFALPDQARTLERIAATDGEAFYRGDLAKRIAAHAKATGGAMTLDDLASHAADWVEPVSVNYRGVTLHEIPPNGQGIAALGALGILKHWSFHGLPPDSADSVHLQAEAMKLAFADAYRYVGDPAAMPVPARRLLARGYLAERAKLIDMGHARQHPPGDLPGGGTVYLAAADADGRMVSLIQSNYGGFGSGIVVPGTGIALQNRAAGFVLTEGHPNQVDGGKRPFHTIIPAFVTRKGKPLMAFGVMGGPMQPQGHVQMMVRLFDYGQNPQAAADAPRWQIQGDGALALEPGLAPGVADELARRGHAVRPVAFGPSFGGAQLIYRLPHAYAAASEPRKDGQAVGF
ncbi:MAG TPA: gamma-glutamyltransferase family protein [Planctomycetota bacterium]|nr:gamma-glutamyltransferase family protein [Planctomycetota bacterium]